jgi:5-hydroxyisourate hydrolase-like protein (transthyretin family)
MLTSKKIRLVLIGSGLMICLSLLIPLLRAAPERSLGTIFGRVTRDGGVPAASVTVTAIPAALPFARYIRDNPNTAVTDADGRYALHLYPMHIDSYSGPVLFHVTGDSIFVSDDDQTDILPLAQTIDPTGRPRHTVTGVDFLLHTGPQVTVRARDAITGTPDPGLSIDVVDSVTRHMTIGVTGSDGTLRFHVPLTKFTLETKLPDTLEGAPGYGAGGFCVHPFKASPGQELVWDLKTYSTGMHISDTGAKSFGPNPDCDWHGTVLGPDGHPARNVRVTILRESGTDEDLRTDAQGRFSARLPRLSYGEAKEWNPHTLPVVVARQGKLVATQKVTPDESWDGMTLRLAPSASLSGQLTTAQGRPAAGMIVSLSATLSHNQWTATPTAITDEQGRFTLYGLPPGDYQVRAHGGNFSNLVIPDRPSTALTAGPYLTLGVGHHLDLGRHVVLTADQELTGSVVDEQGNPVPSLYVSVTGTHTDEAVVTQQDGTFHVYHLGAEPLTVTVGNPPSHTVNAVIAPGQKTLSLVARPDVVATNGLASPPPHPAPPAKPSPTGPPEVTFQPTQILLNGLRLVISPGDGGTFMATIDQPNSLNLLMAMGGYSGTVEFPKSLTDLSGSMWSGTLADVEGMRLTTRQDQGRLTDGKGRVLWSGRVWTQPAYIIVSKTPPAHGTAHTTVIDTQGKTLWSGAVAPDALNQITHDGDLRIIGAAHDVVWERPIGDDGVAFVEGDPHDLWSRVGPIDGTLMLHLGAGTATLRSSDGHVVASVPTPIVTMEDTFPSAPTIRTGADGKPTPALLAWAGRRQFLCSPKTTLLVTVQNAPPRSTLTLTDRTSHPLRYRQSFP